jgi:hypothetical protein
MPVTSGSINKPDKETLNSAQFEFSIFVTKEEPSSLFYVIGLVNV